MGIKWDLNSSFFEEMVDEDLMVIGMVVSGVMGFNGIRVRSGEIM